MLPLPNITFIIIIIVFIIATTTITTNVLMPQLPIENYNYFPLQILYIKIKSTIQIYKILQLFY